MSILTARLNLIIIHIQELDDNLAELTSQFEAATEAKLKCQREAEATALTISLANRLVGGLASEKVRWAESVGKLKEDEKTLGKMKYNAYSLIPRSYLVSCPDFIL